MLDQVLQISLLVEPHIQDSISKFPTSLNNSNKTPILKPEKKAHLLDFQSHQERSPVFTDMSGRGKHAVRICARQKGWNNSKRQPGNAGYSIRHFPLSLDAFVWPHFSRQATARTKWRLHTVMVSSYQLTLTRDDVTPLQHGLESKLTDLG
jgi:hypothetical protein